MYLSYMQHYMLSSAGLETSQNIETISHMGKREKWQLYRAYTIIYISAECGDYVVEDYPDHTYLSSYKFVPHQDAELERKIMENHKKHV